jgi:PHD/YefM family antitoxin component YafN of YafNO toxin-antitoxin module
MLEEMRKTISLTQLAKDAERIARDIDSSGAVYHVKRPGHRDMLLMDEEYFEGWRVVFELMQRPSWREELEQSRRDFAAGRHRELDEVAKELGLDRPAQPRRRSTAPRAAAASRTKSTRRTSRSRGRTA